MLSGERLKKAAQAAVTNLRQRFPYMAATDAELYLAVVTGVVMAGEETCRQSSDATNRSMIELGRALENWKERAPCESQNDARH